MTKSHSSKLKVIDRPSPDSLKKIEPTTRHNYVAFFLTLACNLKCHYCINLHDENPRSSMTRHGHMSVDDWIMAANRLKLRDDLPLTLQGGEPTVWKGFYKFINEIRSDIKCDLMTNMTFDVDQFIAEAPVSRFVRDAPYASIRVSYHPGQNDIDELIQKYHILTEAGYKVGLYGILHPEPSKKKHIMEVMEKCKSQGVDFRTKEYLGDYDGKLYGTFKYEGAILGKPFKFCNCRTSELIVDPKGYVYKCHSDLYQSRDPYAHILDVDLDETWIDEYRPCDFYGDCNPCDIKVKTNRLQKFGHTSVDIIDLAE